MIALLERCTRGLILLCILLVAGCQRLVRPHPSPVVTTRAKPDMAALHVPVCPGARLAPGENGIAAPLGGGVAYTFRLQVRAEQAQVVAYYMSHLRNVKMFKRGTAVLIGGQTDAGDEVTVVPEERRFRVKRKDGRTEILTITDFLVTVRKVTAPRS